MVRLHHPELPRRPRAQRVPLGAEHPQAPENGGRPAPRAAPLVCAQEPCEVTVLDPLIAHAGAFYVLDRGDIDFARRHRLHPAGRFFVTRAKEHTEV